MSSEPIRKKTWVWELQRTAIRIAYSGSMDVQVKGRLKHCATMTARKIRLCDKANISAIPTPSQFLSFKHFWYVTSAPLLFACTTWENNPPRRGRRDFDRVLAILATENCGSWESSSTRHWRVQRYTGHSRIH